MEEIDSRIQKAGYRMLGKTDEEEDLIIDILKTENTRYLKAIPYLIYTKKIEPAKLIERTDKKDLLYEILNITSRIFEEFNIKIDIPKYKSNKELDYKEFRDEFELQTKQDLLIDKERAYKEREEQKHLSRLFTKKEKQIIKRMLEEKPISRTDYEYYSRKTKKKLNSIIGLNELAKILHGKNPKYDEELYKLKKELEEWLEKKKNEKNIEIQKFFTWDNNKIFIVYTKKDHKYSNNQSFNTTIKLKKIKNKKIKKLLKKYKKEDFR